MKRPNELVQMDTKGPFYLKASRIKHYYIHAIDDCSRKVVSKWCNRRTTEEALSVLKEWVKLHGKPMKVMHDGGKEFTSTDVSYPQWNKRQADTQRSSTRTR